MNFVIGALVVAAAALCAINRIADHRRVQREISESHG